MYASNVNHRRNHKGDLHGRHRSISNRDLRRAIEDMQEDVEGLTGQMYEELVVVKRKLRHLQHGIRRRDPDDDDDDDGEEEEEDGDQRRRHRQNGVGARNGRRMPD